MIRINERFDAIDAQFDDLRRRFDAMFETRRKDMKALTELVATHNERFAKVPSKE